jgi:DNA replication protein DnaC
MTSVAAEIATLPALAKALRLPAIARCCESLAATAEAEAWPCSRYLQALLDEELRCRADRRVMRLIRQAQLPAGKTIAGFDFAAVASINQRQINALAVSTDWVETGQNLLFFGPSGTGKTHLAAGIGFALAQAGTSIRYARTTDLVQHLQAAKAECKLPQALARLDRFACLILDDIGYAQRSNAETGVLFELIAHRYEQRSLIVTSNHPFGDWNQIFGDQAMTIAAIDRLVHHSTIFELNTDSYRRKAALKAQRQATS